MHKILFMIYNQHLHIYIDLRYGYFHIHATLNCILLAVLPVIRRCVGNPKINGSLNVNL